MKYDIIFLCGLLLAYSMLGMVAFVESGLYDPLVCGVFAVVGIVLMYGVLCLNELQYRKERREEIMQDEELEPIGAYGKSFHSLKIRELLVRSKEKCPRCYASLWRKEGLEYKDRFGASVQLWKCLSCGYEEERFVE